MECTRLVALAVTVAAALGTALAGPGAWPVGPPEPVSPAPRPATGPVTAVLASGGSAAGTFRAANRAW
jgi:hypothetical protein